MPMQNQREDGGTAPPHSQPQHQKEVWGVSTMPWLLYLWEIYGTHCTGGWVGLAACLDGHGMSHLC